MSSEIRLVMVDGRDALANVIIRPGTKEGTVELEADSNGLSGARAAQVLRHIADRWGPRPGLVGVLDDVAAERARQDRQWGPQNHPDGTGHAGDREAADHWRAQCQRAAALGEMTWAGIAREEDAEAYAERDPVRLRAELIQAIAVKVAWVEAIDRRTGGLGALLEAVTEQLPADNPSRAAEGLARMAPREHPTAVDDPKGIES